MLADFLIHDKKLKDDYDLFALAGAELGANEKKMWKKALYEHIDIAIKLHKINEILVFSHLDCGAYKIFKEMDTDTDQHIHLVELDKLRKAIKKKYPKLIYKGYIMDTQGKIYKMD